MSRGEEEQLRPHCWDGFSLLCPKASGGPFQEKSEGRAAEGGAGSDPPCANGVLSYSFLADQAKAFGRFTGGSAPGGSATIPAARTSKEPMARSGGRNQLVPQEFRTDGREDSFKLT